MYQLSLINLQLRERTKFWVLGRKALPFTINVVMNSEADSLRTRKFRGNRRVCYYHRGFPSFSVNHIAFGLINVEAAVIFIFESIKSKFSQTHQVKRIKFNNSRLYRCDHKWSF